MTAPRRNATQGCHPSLPLFLLVHCGGARAGKGPLDHLQLQGRRHGQVKSCTSPTAHSGCFPYRAARVLKIQSAR